jgi:hypothetical protein
VYLDQNKWLDLARAATGHRLGARFVDALAAARAATATGTASFPIDIYRYLETGKRGDDRSRIDVADLMFELSQQHTMARSNALLPTEIDQALKRRFGRPEQPRQHQVFGVGLSHITAGAVTHPPFDPSKLPATGKTLSPHELLKVEQIYNDLVGRELLRMGPDPVREAGFDPSNTELAQCFVDYENSIAAAIHDQGLSGALLELAVRASDLGGIQGPVSEALNRIGMTWDAFIVQAGPSELREFVDDLPTRNVTNLMRSAKLRQTEQKWELNDFNDLAALPVAAVYCDVVVTEKQWVHWLRQGDVDKRYKTKLLSDTAGLVDVLCAPSS